MISEVRIEVFVGGPLDGMRIPQADDSNCLTDYLTDEIYDVQTLNVGGRVLSFWKLRDLPVEDAATRLLLYYQPYPPPRDPDVVDDLDASD